MDNLEKLKRELKAMDKSKKNELVDALDSALSDAQKRKLKKMMTDKSGKAELERQLEKVDLDKLLASAGSKQELLSYISQSDVKDKLKDILG